MRKLTKQRFLRNAYKQIQVEQQKKVGADSLT